MGASTKTIILSQLKDRKTSQASLYLNLWFYQFLIYSNADFDIVNCGIYDNILMFYFCLFLFNVWSCVRRSIGVVKIVFGGGNDIGQLGRMFLWLGKEYVEHTEFNKCYNSNTGRSKVFWLSTSPASEGSSSSSSPSSGSLWLSSTSSRRKSPSKHPSTSLENTVFSLLQFKYRDKDYCLLFLLWKSSIVFHIKSGVSSWWILQDS